MDIAVFLSRYLSGNPNVFVSMNKSSASGFAAIYRVSPKGRPYWTVILPHWETFVTYMPLRGFDAYRIYRHGVWHEACHVRFTPPSLFQDRETLGVDPITWRLINVIEDKRIEGLGLKEWVGYIPEQIYTRAYAYAIRPSLDKLLDRDHQVFEALMQKVLIGKMKGKMSDPNDLDKVEKAAELIDKKIPELNQIENEHKLTRELVELARQVKDILDLKMEPPRPRSSSDHDWEDTFTPSCGGSRRPGDVKEDMEEYFEEQYRQAKERKEGEEKKDPTEITKDDVDQARKGSCESQAEWEKACQVKAERVDPDIQSFQSSVAQGPVEIFKDAKFIHTMNTLLQTYREGFKEVVGKSGTRFSVKEYIKHKDEPFVTRLKKSVKGKKILLVADFSGSMKEKEDDYKKAIISALTVLDGIGCNIGVFTFANDPALGHGYYRIKTFEEPKVTKTHLAKIAGLTADYPSTPTATIYRALYSYITKHRPEVTVTITDGEPDSESDTFSMVKSLKPHTRMVAFGIASDSIDQPTMAAKLKNLGYHDSFAVNNVHEIPPKLIQLIIPR